MSYSLLSPPYPPKNNAKSAQLNLQDSVKIRTFSTETFHLKEIFILRNTQTFIINERIRCLKKCEKCRRVKLSKQSSDFIA